MCLGYNSIWRVVREVEGASLEMMCSQKEPRVRIPNPPPQALKLPLQGFFFLSGSPFKIIPIALAEAILELKSKLVGLEVLDVIYILAWKKVRQTHSDDKRETAS